ncbi:hypothetical protein C5Y96_19190 [Blastopirellula marina]|uniref:LysM domain-containing protein n=1 Tax=Blastopirellula marina TaxID=124 RepID=A0A2S8F691_9BACT|nr:MULTISPECIES: hypothetical protein [Pirellulaceae]PQO27653.1 hypothetical protein C5Y96_19190 [Blastopirellula marina]RCS48191.1 hypothetical protein DTL36_19220 [Bremerella cremea]
MSVLRNLLIVGLLVCVAYNGYVIYRNQMASSPSGEAKGPDTAPLFSEEAFAELAENRSQISVQEVPTVLTTEQAKPADQFVANPVLEKQPDSLPVIPVSANTPATNPGSRFSADAATQTVSTPAPEAEAPAPQDITPQALSFEDAWAEIEASEAGFTWATALAQIQRLAYREDLTDPQREQVLAKGNELAKTVIFAPNKHLAKPALTFRPGMSLEEVSQEHNIPESFLRSINQWADDYNPTPGDSIKVLEGPITLHVDLPSKSIRVAVGQLYAGHMAIGQHSITIPENAKLNAETIEGVTKLSLGEVAVVIDTENQVPAANSLLVTAEDWKLLQSIASDSVEVTWTALPAPPAPQVAATEPVKREVKSQFASEKMQHPVDALKMEIFTPSATVIQGKPVQYGIEITNLSDKPSDLVQAVVNMSEGIEPIQVEGHTGRIAPGQALFDPLTIEAGQSVRLTVTVETKEAGQFLIRPELQCSRPATRYASEVQLRVAAAESISAETEQTPPEPAQPKESVAEVPQNPAKEIR